jgi:hypothetical protein
MDPIQNNMMAQQILNTVLTQKEAARAAKFDRVIADPDDLLEPPLEPPVEKSEGRGPEDERGHRPPAPDLPKRNYGKDGRLEEVEVDEPAPPGPPPPGHLDIRV